MHDPSDDARPQPPSTTLAALSLTLGILGLFTLGLCGVGSLIGLSLSQRALHRARVSPQTNGGRGIAIAGALLNVLALALAALIIAMLGSRNAPYRANESATIGDMRALASAQAAYRNVNGGYFDTIECLVKPQDCLEGFDGPPFIGDWLYAQKSGYDRTFVAGPRPKDLPAKSSKTSLESYAYYAKPIRPGDTGVRGFCVDSRAEVCATDDGASLVVTGPLCPASCAPLR
jgi:hypothetical protein